MDAPRSFAFATSSMDCEPAVERQYYEASVVSDRVSVVQGPTYRDAKFSSDLCRNKLSERVVELVDTNRGEHDRYRDTMTKNSG